MSEIIVRRAISAPVSLVFAVVSDIRKLSRALPHVVRYEFITGSEPGVGTRFMETRRIGKKEGVTELEITEYVKDERVRMVADSHGTIWDTLFLLSRSEGQTLLTLTLDARSYKLLPKLLYPLYKGVVAKAVERDADLIKIHCEMDRN